MFIEEDPPELKDDLKKIKLWVRDDLFNICKFLYSEKDIAPNGKVYQIFEKQCLQNLIGVKARNGDQDKLKFYVSKIWERATTQNIVNNVLNIRRSGVYTVMVNRFNGTLDSGLYQVSEQRLMRLYKHFSFF